MTSLHDDIKDYLQRKVADYQEAVSSEAIYTFVYHIKPILDEHNLTFRKGISGIGAWAIRSEDGELIASHNTDSQNEDILPDDIVKTINMAVPCGSNLASFIPEYCPSDTFTEVEKATHKMRLYDARNLFLRLSTPIDGVEDCPDFYLLPGLLKDASDAFLGMHGRLMSALDSGVYEIEVDNEAGHIEFGPHSAIHMIPVEIEDNWYIVIDPLKWETGEKQFDIPATHKIEKLTFDEADKLYNEIRLIQNWWLITLERREYSELD